MRTRFLGLATALASLVVMKSASAQTAAPIGPFGSGFALQQFDPAPAGDRFFAVNDAHVASGESGFRPNLMLLGNYALKPLVLRDASSDSKVATLTSSQLYLHLDGSIALFDRLLVHVDVPFAMVQSGDQVPDAPPGTTNSISGGKLADIRAGARVNLIGTYKDPFALAIASDVWLPTGDPNALTSDAKLDDPSIANLTSANPNLATTKVPRVDVKLLASGATDTMAWGVGVGYLFRHFQDLGTPVVGSAITFNAGIAALLADQKLQIGPELYGNTVIDTKDRTGAVNKFLGVHHTPLEAILGLKYRISDVVLGAAAGPGFTKAPGTAELRALLSVSLVPQIEEKPKDRDNDGIVDEKDACPDTPGVPSADPKLNGCPPPPPPDRDGDTIPDAQDACPDTPGVASADPKKNGCPADRDNDGVPDAQDACPDVAGVPDADPKKNGCPPDKDGDGVPDAQDACPDVAGVKSDDPKKNGCPPDKDGDGIPDAQDACPDTPGMADPDPKKNGCPKLAQIVGKEIKISEQVHFETGKAVIKPDSDALLGEVASILKEHSEIDRLVIEGHTDNVGNKNANQILSMKRATAVKDWLVKKGGIDKKRLDAVGYGQTKPIAPNDTEEGRAQNRRVEFHIAKESVKVPAEKPEGAPKAGGDAKAGGAAGGGGKGGNAGGGTKPAPKPKK